MTRAPLSRSKGQSSRSPGRFTYRCVVASGSCSGGRGNVLTVHRKLLLRCRLLSGARSFGAYGGGERRGHIVAAARLQLVYTVLKPVFYHCTYFSEGTHICYVFVMKLCCTALYDNATLGTVRANPRVGSSLTGSGVNCLIDVQITQKYKPDNFAKCLSNSNCRFCTVCKIQTISFLAVFI